MAKKTKRKPNAAFMKPVQPSATLAEVVGSKPIPRTEVTKKLWAYIKKNGLQDKKNRRMINSDDTLKAVYGDGDPLLFISGFTGVGADWRHIFPSVPPRLSADGARPSRPRRVAPAVR